MVDRNHGTGRCCGPGLQVGFGGTVTGADGREEVATAISPDGPTKRTQ